MLTVCGAGLQVKSELRTERKDRKGKETQMFILSQEHTKVRVTADTVSNKDILRILIIIF
jgi:hypothetical protein